MPGIHGSVCSEVWEPWVSSERVRAEAGHCQVLLQQQQLTFINPAASGNGIEAE